MTYVLFCFFCNISALTHSDLMIIYGFIDIITFQLTRGCLSRLQTNHAVDKNTHMTAFFRGSLFSVVFLVNITDSDTSKVQLKYFQGWVCSKSGLVTVI